MVRPDGIDVDKPVLLRSTIIATPACGLI